ncbi:hypothetical protein MCOR27_006061 [Pyricularia oryzae]|uniref:BAG domain-containing protein n=1 Tax=Pyricularia grisea TaxID=148305 RepID=A0ABQ8NB75_PYRGI|nr:hypothetical protein MCOR01_003943 [Pyricularia oryzae]KAI6294307.1 hypothetical protein MCOR33_008552 [Pyricularia grisea]KAI6274291.1 hypothetical protein MCOR26_006533 [Pyricularia oryzae]KAI6277303.1 hypothetical protein MCOR27_006061 [Pyricularia oryzae]KAI6315103.1 hypothetical protein MCOR30_009746 [Pyricularia oryzae]
MAHTRRTSTLPGTVTTQAIRASSALFFEFRHFDETGEEWVSRRINLFPPSADNQAPQIPCPPQPSTHPCPGLDRQNSRPVAELWAIQTRFNDRVQPQCIAFISARSKDVTFKEHVRLAQELEQLLTDVDKVQGRGNKETARAFGRRLVDKMQAELKRWIGLSRGPVGYAVQQNRDSFKVPSTRTVNMRTDYHARDDQKEEVAQRLVAGATAKQVGF